MSEAKWDVVLEGRSEGDPTYKARVKRFTWEDSLQKTQLERRLIEANKTKGNPDREVGLLYLVNFFPLLKLGIAEADGFKLPLHVNTFWKLPEQFILMVAESIREVNPQYAIPFSDMLRVTSTDSTPLSANPSSDTSSSGESASTGSGESSISIT